MLKRLAHFLAIHAIKPRWGRIHFVLAFTMGFTHGYACFDPSGHPDQWLEVDWCLSGLSDHNLLRNLAGRGFAAGRNQGDQKPLKRLGSVWLVFSPR